MLLTPGARIGAYEIVALLGIGGMGEVYRARDARLGRDVAIKILPAEMSNDPERLQRFELEARAAAALNHPNILAVHDVGHYSAGSSGQGAAPYIVSELLEGETLRERLKSGAIPFRKAAEYAMQIARGLVAAHEKGLVHRDLKPENIFVTTDGRVKLLDFGLVKLTQAEPLPPGNSALPTTAPDTLPGVVLGTVGYMSPEQVRGVRADHRSDIFAFGATLYEMLAGKRAFDGETSADTMSAVLTKEPLQLAENGGGASSGLDRIVRHCLEKAPEQRFQSARDVVFAIEGLSSSGAVNVASTADADSIRTPQWSRLLKWAAISALAIWALVVTIVHLRELRSSPAGVVQFSVSAPENSYFAADGDVAIPQMAVSPDGRTLLHLLHPAEPAWGSSGFGDWSPPRPLPCPEQKTRHSRSGLPTVAGLDSSRSVS